MEPSLEDVLISVWRQTLVDNAARVKIGSDTYPGTQSKAKRLRQVAFAFDGKTIMGVVAGEKITLYGGARRQRAPSKVGSSPRSINCRKQTAPLLWDG